jgi:hypothetical protein
VAVGQTLSSLSAQVFLHDLLVALEGLRRIPTLAAERNRSFLGIAGLRKFLMRKA